MAMADSTRRLTTLGVAVGAGVLAGAGQLGVGYGLGILRWDRDFTADAWHTQLAWVAFLSTVAVIAGAAAGRARAGGVTGIGARAALVAAGTLGSLIVLPLVIRPAGASHLAESGDPRLIAAITAGVGLGLGAVAAAVVLSVPVVSGNIVTSVAWVWLAGIGSAVWTLGRGASWGTARLGLLPGTGVWIPVVLFGALLVISAAVAGLARLGGNDPRFTAVSGAAGPALIAAAYLIAGPGSGAAAQAYRYALIAVVVAAAASVLIAVLRRPRPAAPATVVVPAITSTAGESQPTIEPWESPTRTPDYGWSSEPSSSHPLPEPIRAEPVDTSRAEPTVTAPAPTPEAEAEAAGSGSRRRGFGLRRGRSEEPAPAPPPVATPEPVAAREPVAAPEPTPEPAAIPRQRGRKAQKQAEQAEQQTEQTGQAERRAEPARPPVDEPKPSGRRSRRRAADSQPQESEYVDWVKGLSEVDSTVRVGGAARHAKPTDRPAKD
jgi:hypothetical protein